MFSKIWHHLFMGLLWGNYGVHLSLELCVWIYKSQYEIVGKSLSIVFFTLILSDILCHGKRLVLRHSVEDKQFLFWNILSVINCVQCNIINMGLSFLYYWFSYLPNCVIFNCLRTCYVLFYRLKVKARCWWTWCALDLT